MRKPRKDSIAAFSDWRGSEVPENLAALNRTDGLVDVFVDVFTDESDVSVRQEEVGATSVSAAKVIKVC